MKPTYFRPLLLALLIGGSGLALAGGPPVRPSSAQLSMQNQDTTVLNLLSAQGYSQATDLQQNGGTYTAMVMKDGKQMHVTIDPQTGAVSGM
jgi:thiamine biosynthesis lipoprotein ApbE